jgi:hypothetical protein
MNQNISFKDVFKFLGMAIGTGVSGLVVSFGTAFSLAVLLRNTQNGWGGLAGLVIGLVFFYPVGVILGQIIFKLWHFRGSLLLGIAGVILSVLLIVALNYWLHVTTNSKTLLFVLYICAPLFGAVGYYLGRRKVPSV